MMNLNESQSITLNRHQDQAELRKSTRNVGGHQLLKTWIQDLAKRKEILDGWEKESMLILKLVRLATLGREKAPALDSYASQLTGLLQTEIGNLKNELSALEWQTHPPALDKTFSRREIQQCKQQMSVITKNYIDLRNKVLEELALSFPLCII